MNPVKIEFNFGNGYDAEVLRRAYEILSGKPNVDITNDLELDRVNFSLVFPAVYAVCVAIIKAGRMPCPLAVDMRHETPDERLERLRGLASEIFGTVERERSYVPA